MGKKKSTKNQIGEYVWKEMRDNPLLVANDIITTVRTYTSMMDGSKPSAEELEEIHKLCALNPKMIDLICEAFRDEGYNDF